MNSPEARRLLPILRWQNLFEAALFETDLQALPQRINLAKKAIRAQVKELLCSGENSETDALIETVNMLDDLLRMQRCRPKLHKAEQ